MIEASDFPKYYHYTKKILVGDESLLEKNIMRYTTFRSLDDIAQNKFFVRERKTFDDLRERGIRQKSIHSDRLWFVGEPIPEQILQLDNKIDYSYQLFTSCWTMHEHENALMWKAFRADVLLHSTVKLLLDAIDTKDVKLIVCNKVSYEKEHFKGVRLSNEIFEKVPAYKDERELRFYVEFENQPIGDGAFVKLAKPFLTGLTFSPFLKTNNVDDIITKNKIPNNYIVASEIIENYAHT